MRVHIDQSGALVDVIPLGLKPFPIVDALRLLAAALALPAAWLGIRATLGREER